MPTVVGANGTSLGAIGRINCEIEIGKKRFKQTFLVCENLTRSLILGVDFAKQHAAGVHWTKHNFHTHYRRRNSSRDQRTSQ